MAWIKSFQELGRHPKTKRLARALGVSVPDAIGRLHLLWWWAISYAPDGDLSSYDAEDIADAMMWEGDPIALVTALLECGPHGPGFLEQDPDEGTLLIHDWDENCGKEFEKRKKDAERKRRERGADVQRTSDGQTEDVQRMSEVRGEEKRGEEKRGEETTPPTPPSGGACVPEGDEAKYPPLFEAFWGAYPRRVEKQAAYKRWLALAKAGVDPLDLLNAADAYTSSVIGTPPDKIKHAATFLSMDRWKDWLPPEGASYLEAEKLRQTQPRGRDSPEAQPQTWGEAVERFRKRHGRQEGQGYAGTGLPALPGPHE